MKKKSFLYIISFIIAILYFFYNKFIIKHLHFDEDAYILFRYVDMFNKGYGITYYPKAMPIEGATDFLWLIFIAGIARLGIDIGTSAIILNSFGVFGITYIFTKLISKNIRKNYLLLPISFLWILFFPLIAALGGFSVLFYCFSIVLLLYLIDEKGKYYLVPYFALVLGLIRPDGVILGGLLVISVFFLAEKSQYKRIINSGIICFTIGITYFIWRYQYFGNLLPLPLYVKSSENIFNNISYNLSQSLEYKQFYLYFVLFLVCIIITNKELRKKFLIISIPFLVHYISFLISKQSQNIGFRFQAPTIIFFIYSSTSILSKTKFRLLSVKKATQLFAICLVGFSAFKTINYIYFYFKPSKSLTPVFAYQLSKQILKGNEVIALTEAGRLAFYQQKDNPIIDLVGLNTEYTAKHELTQKYITSNNPDILFFWGQNNFSKKYNFQRKLAINFVDKNEFIHLFNYKNIIDINKDSTKTKITMSIKQSLIYLYNNWDKYDVYFINLDQNNRFDYIYAFKKKFNKSNNSIDKLFQEMYKEKPLSYSELEKLKYEKK